MNEYDARSLIAAVKRVAIALEGINQHLQGAGTAEQERAEAVAAGPDQSPGPQHLTVPNSGAV